MSKFLHASLAVLAACVVGSAVPAAAQRGPAPDPDQTPQSAAPIDLTGQWVAVVTEDWRWRMVTPSHGDFASIPLNTAGQEVARAWDLAADNAAGMQCRAYGAGGLLRIPTRLRIAWADEDTLRLETDAGEQVRLYDFIDAAPGRILPQLDDPPVQPGAPSWQGETRAQWYKQPQSRGLGFGGGLGEGGALRAVTHNVLPGYLRKNGIPYSEDTVITEQFSLLGEVGGETWLVVTTIVEDPQFLREPYITSSNFRREDSRERWSPTPCYTDPPVGPPAEAE